MTDVISVLSERGFVDQTTHDEELKNYLSKGSATCYIGFDPTASSLHVGSLVPIMSLAHMQRHGHQPIALVGGGTGLVGDPSGKTEMRKLLTSEEVDENAKAIKAQLARFIDFNGDSALLVNNIDWLGGIEYIPFLRDIGRHFSVNRMIKAESYKARLESEEGLNFIEFNYMILQAYDFLKLCDQFDCMIQMGGSDQWGNIVAGIDLIRRMRQKTAFGITFPLITTSNGAKMGKTAKGAVWLDPVRTSPYEYFQFWVNTDDRDVSRFLALFTFLPIEEINMAERLEGADLNSVKAILAFEATLIAHGSEEADAAFQASRTMFGGHHIPKDLLPSSTIMRESNLVDDQSIPCMTIELSEIESGIPVFKLFQMVGLANSGSESRRLIKQGGGYLNGHRIEDAEELITSQKFNNSEIILRAGKKRFHKVKLAGVCV